MADKIFKLLFSSQWRLQEGEGLKGSNLPSGPLRAVTHPIYLYLWISQEPACSAGLDGERDREKDRDRSDMVWTLSTLNFKRTFDKVKVTAKTIIPHDGNEHSNKNVKKKNGTMNEIKVFTLCLRRLF